MHLEIETGPDYEDKYTRNRLLVLLPHSLLGVISICLSSTDRSRARSATHPVAC